MRVFIVLSFLLLFFACKESPDEMGLKSITAEVTTLESQLKKIKTQNDSLQLMLEDYRLPEDSNWFGDVESRAFKDMGIENPQIYLSEALRNRPSMIPIDGVLGGTMFFTDVEVLGSKWIIASYEDGHIMGRSIFTYQVNPETLEVEFALLDQVADF